MTVDEITDRQIRQLQAEAAEAGDLDMVVICRLACGDYEEATSSEQTAAREKCASVIDDAEVSDFGGL